MILFRLSMRSCGQLKYIGRVEYDASTAPVPKPVLMSAATASIRPSAHETLGVTVTPNRPAHRLLRAIVQFAELAKHL